MIAARARWAGWGRGRGRGRGRAEPTPGHGAPAWRQWGRLPVPPLVPSTGTWAEACAAHARATKSAGSELREGVLAGTVAVVAAAAAAAVAASARGGLIAVCRGRE
eukprot:352825-Chlamydomonas_euryale.AAC.4